MSKLHILDSNVFIEAEKRFYANDFCPGFWQWLDSAQENGIVTSIDMVLNELNKGTDVLSNWATERKGTNWFITVADIPTQRMYSEIINYVENEYENQGKKAKFFSGADPWIIAKAVTTNSVVVTQEVLVDINSSSIKIPNICNHFNVSYINIFELIRKSKIRFMLEQ